MEHELIVGNIYYVWDEGAKFWMIGQHKGGNRKVTNGFRDTVIGIISSKPDYEENRDWCYKDADRHYRDATWKEQMWLLSCIEKGKYMPKEEALKHYNTYSIY